MPEPTPPPRLLIDATSVPEDLGGVGRYVVALVQALSALGASPWVVCQPRDVERFRSAGASRTIVAPPSAASAPGRFVWEQLGLPRLIRRERIRVLHSPHYTFPLVTGARRVVSVHDLTFFTLPRLHGTVKRVFFRAWIRAAARLGLAVVAPSEATKADFVRIAHGRPGSVVVAPHGYDEAVFHPVDPAGAASFAARVAVPEAGWIAFLGTLEPRKNVPSLIAAYRAAVGDLDAARRPALLLAGGPGWDRDVPAAVARARRAGFDVRALGYLPLADLPAFLAGAELVAYPSLGEGFGLPVLEAMACGACVLTTSRPALPEVGGDAVQYADVGPASIASALRSLLADGARRVELRRAGRERAAAFTWERSARAHLEAYGLRERTA